MRTWHKSMCDPYFSYILFTFVYSWDLNWSAYTTIVLNSLNYHVIVRWIYTFHDFYDSPPLNHYDSSHPCSHIQYEPMLIELQAKDGGHWWITAVCVWWGAHKTHCVSSQRWHKSVTGKAVSIYSLGSVCSRFLRTLRQSLVTFKTLNTWTRTSGNLNSVCLMSCTQVAHAPGSKSLLVLEQQPTSARWF